MGPSSDKEIEANGGQVTVSIRESIHESEIRKNFKPIALIGMWFGLFPCYDLSFKENIISNPRRLKFMQVIRVIYSFTLLALMTGGAILCWIQKPANLEAMYTVGQNDKTDMYVLLVTKFFLLAMGILSPFVFLRQSANVLRYIDRFVQIDKILCFDGESQKKESRFAKKLLRQFVVLFFSCSTVYTALFILVKPEIKKTTTDYLMVPLGTLATMTHVIPSASFVFFMNGIRGRLKLFNEKMKMLILPITPSCSSCESYADFGEELDVCPRLSSTLAEDLDKMRVLHEEISSLTDETSNLFGFHIIREFLFCFTAVLGYTYMSIFKWGEDSTYMIVFPLLDLFILGKMLYISTFAHLITWESAASLKLLNKACFLRLSPECTIQVESFIKKLETPNQITAAGFFTVNRGCVTAMAGALATFFIILLQFKMSDLSDKFKDMRNGTDAECFNSNLMMY